MKKTLLNMEPGAVLSGILAMGVTAALLVGYVAFMHRPGETTASEMARVEFRSFTTSVPEPPEPPQGHIVIVRQRS